MQLTAERLKLSTINRSGWVVVSNEENRFIVSQQLSEINIKVETIILEPFRRNTAPAIAAAALQALKSSQNAVLLVLSADHVIKDVDAFHASIKIASIQAQEGKLATFGIVPKDANTGYGYIKSSKDSTDGGYKVEEFVEKPDQETAQAYLEQGNYLWNSGMFMFKANVLIDELTTHSSDIVKFVNKAVNNAEKDLDFIRLDKEAFESSPSDSIDYHFR